MSSDLRQAMAGMDFTGGDVVGGADAEPATIVFSSRMPSEWSDEIMAEVQRRGMKNPSQWIKAVVRDALDRAQAGEVHDPRTANILSHLDAARRELLSGKGKPAAA